MNFAMLEVLKEIRSEQESFINTYNSLKQTTIFVKETKKNDKENSKKLTKVIPLLYNIAERITKIKTHYGRIAKIYLTGFGANIIIIDDLIKNAEEANNENVLEKHWEWFTNTMLSRLETGGKIIIIMTRWHSNDLAGKALNELERNGYKIKHITMKALKNNGELLCDEVLPRYEYDRKVKTMGSDIASANYQQEPIDLKGRLYQGFKTYDRLDFEFMRIRSYTDTADQGSDYLCSIIYGEYQKEAYVLDVYYTKDGMEITEEEVAKRHYEYGVNIADIESNNGGRGFARNIERILKEKYKTNKTRVNWFHQGANKIARIISNSTWIMDHIYFPVNWRNKYPEYYDAMTKYQKEGKNKHDDAPDATTGIAEKIINQNKLKTLNKNILGVR